EERPEQRAPQEALLAAHRVLDAERRDVADERDVVWPLADERGRAALAPTRESRRRRNARRRSSLGAGRTGILTSEGTRSKPMRRATSSMRSISEVTSGRQEGRSAKNSSGNSSSKYVRSNPSDFRILSISS